MGDTEEMREVLQRVLRTPPLDIVKATATIEFGAAHLLIAMSRDLEALTAKVDALVENLPENQPTNMQDILHVATCDHCGRPSGIDYCPMCGWGTDNDD